MSSYDPIGYARGRVFLVEDEPILDEFYGLLRDGDFAYDQTHGVLWEFTCQGWVDVCRNSLMESEREHYEDRVTQAHYEKEDEVSVLRKELNETHQSLQEANTILDALRSPHRECRILRKRTWL